MLRFPCLFFLLPFGSALACAGPCIDKKEPRCPFYSSSIAFEAVAITAGPYGELWQVKYAGGNSIDVAINYMVAQQGKLAGTFLVSPEGLKKLKRIVKENRFFALPKEITPKLIPMRDPDLRLTLSIEGEQHKVSLYSPGGLTSRSDAARFFAVWNEVFSLLPVHPSWSQ